MTKHEQAAANCPIRGVRWADRSKPKSKPALREGLSSDCTLDPMIVFAILCAGREHPCDRCNADRAI